MPTTTKPRPLPDRVYCPDCRRTISIVTEFVDAEGRTVEWQAWCMYCGSRSKVAEE